MSNNPAASFGKFVPGFEFLQSLTKGATQGLPQMPKLGSWVAPTLNVEELDKRISELKTVLFWLEQNSTALKATIQALEVQKMTLATLKGMNLSMSELAESFKLAPQAASPAAAAAARAPEASSKSKAAGRAADGGGGEARAAAPAAAAGVIDPLQWWGALTQQFQQIAASAMRDAAVPAAAGATASGPTKATAKAKAKAKARTKGGTAAPAGATKPAGRARKPARKSAG